MRGWRTAAIPLIWLAACAAQDDAPATPLDGPTTADLCDPSNTSPLRLRFDPPSMVLAPGTSRPARVIVDPDVCAPTELSFEATGGVETPPTTTLDHVAEHAFEVVANAAGRATIIATMRRAVDGAEAHVELAIDVHEPRIPTCEVGATVSSKIDASTPGATAFDAWLSAPAAAFTRTDAVALPALPVTIACAPALTGGAISPAVAFRGPPERMVKPLRHELDFALPVEPAAMPPRSRLRHVQVWYRGPRAKTPRPIAVTNARIEVRGDGYVLAFRSPWLGTYQVAVAPDAGEHETTRRLTHRALLGISMGAGGAASFGLRHPTMFDTIAMLGGPVDWTWLLWYLERYPMGGFCPKGQTCDEIDPGAYPLDEPFAHTMDFDHLWFQDGKGTGGIARSEYLSMLTDLALARGNPLGQNADPVLSFFAAGPKATDPWVTGAPAAGEPDCRVTVRPIPGSPDEAKERERETRCGRTRCDPSHAFVVESGYFDDEYNPDGTERVISFCDGTSTGQSPFKSTWAPPRPGETAPASFAMAVDTNRNGVRDLGEPVIRSGHEPYDDTGTDGLADEAEPGYDAVATPDPDGDDYDPQINPEGTEGDHRHQAGEPFRDVGLDGVADTATRSAVGDVGEGDGAYTEARGLSAFYAVDPHAILRGQAGDAGGASPTDAEIARLRIWTDGGVRDFMNFGRDADHFQGALGTRVPWPRGATFWDGFDALPGQKRGDLRAFDAAGTLWADLPRAVGVRYGDVDATPAMIAQGDGQHVGSGTQILARLSAAYRFIGEGWPAADRALTEPSSANAAESTTDALGVSCEVLGSCSTTFTGPKSGRTAPVTVVLPPGYAHVANQAKRYPVVYVLHGYGQQESDVNALAILTLASMNDPAVSYVDRLPKFIVVYVDGRCREGASGPGCVAGTFFFDSTRPGGPQVATWMEELIAWVDQSFRTMPPSEVEGAD